MMTFACVNRCTGAPGWAGQCTRGQRGRPGCCLAHGPPPLRLTGYAPTHPRPSVALPWPLYRLSHAPCASRLGQKGALARREGAQDSIRRPAQPRVPERERGSAPKACPGCGVGAARPQAPAAAAPRGALGRPHRLMVRQPPHLSDHGLGPYQCRAQLSESQTRAAGPPAETVRLHGSTLGEYKQASPRSRPRDHAPPHVTAVSGSHWCVCVCVVCTKRVDHKRHFFKRIGQWPLEGIGHAGIRLARQR
jgi:hypothetical protein